MRMLNRLMGKLTDPEFLSHAADLTVRGKRQRRDVAWFLFNREAILGDLARRLECGDYRPEGFDLLHVHDPKPRVIARSSVPDRVVQTALCVLAEPVFLRSATDDSFACRRGFGTHRALIRIKSLMQRHRFVVHLDIKKYFPSINIEILKTLIERRVVDRRFLEIVGHVLKAGRGLYDDAQARRFARMSDDWPPRGQGLPIGALTSQLFAGHVYLDAFDHFVKRVLEVPGYVRYMDDFFMFGPTRRELRRWRTAIGEWLRVNRNLRLKYPQARIVSSLGHLDALGHRVRRDGIAPLPRCPLIRLQKRIRRFIHASNATSAHATRLNWQRSIDAVRGDFMFGI